MELEKFLERFEKVDICRNQGNTGDLLIEECLLSLLNKKKINYSFETSGGEVILVLGNGAFCKAWNHQIKNTESLYDKYKEVVILPTTFEVSETRVRNFLQKAPEHLTIFCRERKSYRDVKLITKFPNNVFLDHDLAFSESFDFSKYKKEGGGRLLALRGDKESLFLEEMGEYEKIEDLSVSQKTLEGFLETISEFSEVTTDRLHISISAYRMGKKVNLFPCSYFKNEEIYKFSLSRDDKVNFINSNGGVSVICAVMNRYDQIKISIHSWLAKKEIGEIVIVDWSSDSPFEDIQNLDPRIKYIRVNGERYFNMSKAYNLAASHASLSKILKLDADYIINPYLDFFRDNMIRNKEFCAGENSSRDPVVKYLHGLLYVHTQDFLRVGGYNENLSGYGYDDGDLFDRLSSYGFTKKKLKLNYSIVHLPHGDEERTANYEIKNKNESWAKNRSLSLNQSKKPKEFLIDKESDKNWIKYEAAESYDYSCYNFIGETSIPLVCDLPENGIYRQEGGIVFPDGLVSNGNKEILSELSWYGAFGSDRHKEKSKKFFVRDFSKMKRMKGSCLNLNGAFCEENYGHFLIEFAPKFEIALNSSPKKVNDFDYISIPKLVWREANDIISKLGIPKNKIITISEPTQFDEVFAVSFRGKARASRKGSFDKLIEEPCQEPFRNLYISRRGYKRGPENEGLLEEYLKSRGYQIINPEKEINSKSLFKEAKIVIGPHGSGLSNIIYCNPKKSKIIELIPDFHQYEWFPSLAYSCGLDYTGVICESKNGSFRADKEIISNLI